MMRSRVWESDPFRPYADIGDAPSNDYAAVGPGDPRYDEIVAKVTTDAATAQAQLQSAINAQHAIDSSKKWIWMVAGGLVLVAWMGSKR